MKKLLAKFNKSFNSQKGQSMVEYALILALIVGAAALIMSPIGQSVTAAFQGIIAGFATGGGGAPAN